MNTIARTILVRWPDIHPKAKRHFLFFGDRLDLARHFPCAWAAFSIDVSTDRGLVCFHRSGLMTIGDNFKPIPTLWALRSRWQLITIHAGFIGLASWRFCSEARRRQATALDRARVGGVS